MLDGGALTEILKAFINATTAGHASVNEYALNIFRYFVIAEVALFGIAVALERIEFNSRIAGKVLAIGVIQGLLINYIWVIDILRDSFVGVGLAAGGSNLKAESFLDPSGFIGDALNSIFKIFETKFDQGLFSFMTSISVAVIVEIIVYLIMIFSFIAMALQIFFAVLEFYFVGSLAIIFVPFLVWDKTRSIGSKASSAVLANCIKLMVLAFIASIATPVIASFSLKNGDATLREQFNLLMGTVAVALIMWRAPHLANSFLFGGPAMDLQSTGVDPVKSAASTVVSGAKTAMNAAMSVGQAAQSAAGYASSRMAGFSPAKNASDQSAATGAQSANSSRQKPQVPSAATKKHMQAFAKGRK